MGDEHGSERRVFDGQLRRTRDTTRSTSTTRTRTTTRPRRSSATSRSSTRRSRRRSSTVTPLSSTRPTRTTSLTSASTTAPRTRTTSATSTSTVAARSLASSAPMCATRPASRPRRTCRSPPSGRSSRTSTVCRATATPTSRARSTTRLSAPGRARTRARTAAATSRSCSARSRTTTLTSRSSFPTQTQQGTHSFYEASASDSYTDPGAQCLDYHDHDSLSSGKTTNPRRSILTHASLGPSVGNTHLVMVNGQFGNKLPDLKQPGTYVIKYDCHDHKGNQAVSKYRTVTVRDTTRPTLDLKECTNGKEECRQEAGYAWTDPGVDTADTMDPPFSVKNVVRTATFTQSACAQTLPKCSPPSDAAGVAELVAGNGLSHPHVGTYTLTYHLQDYTHTDTFQDTRGNWSPARTSACSPQTPSRSTCNAAHTVTRTIVVEDTLVPVISLHKGHSSDLGLAQDPFHISDSTATGINGVANEAGDSATNPHFRRLRGAQ